MVDGLNTVNVSVVDLAELCRKGDINYRFSSRSSSQEGIAAHRVVQKSRPDSYKAEYSVGHDVRCGPYLIKVNGRIDGYMETNDGFCVDEIKSIRIPSEDIPDCVLEHFWCQARLYAFLLAREKHLSAIRVRLCLFHLDEDKEFQFEQTYLVGELTLNFVEAIMVLVDRLERRDKWHKTRSSANSNLVFPYKKYRSGQRDMAVSLFRQLKKNGQVVLQAPTGIGKTIGAIFPALHALEASENQRIFYLSAKSSTQQLAESAAKDLVDAGAKLRTLTITAKDKICFNKGLPCDADYCQFAKGYHDRIHSAISDMLEQQDQFNRKNVEKFAEKHSVCPYQLSLDLSAEADLIICDYNYVFDPSVYLRQYFDGSRRDSLALVDEAHNLIDRGRDMFSAEIEKSQFLGLARQFKGRVPELTRCANSVNRAFLAMCKMEMEFESQDFLVQTLLPSIMLKALKKFCIEIENTLRQQVDEEWPDELLNIYFRSLRFIRTAEEYDDDYVTLLSRSKKKQITLKLYCVDPAIRLAAGFDRLAGAACFSATLQPQRYFKAMLGINDNEHWYQLPSPYPDKNLHVAVAGYIDTSFRARESSIQAIVRIIEAMILAKTGGYIVFFPSYRYLELVHQAFIKAHPQIKVVTQSRSMDDQEREEFLELFNGGLVCGFAVMGGVFSEGIDLKGQRLLGAIIIGVGLPRLGIERDLIRDRFADKGYEFAYQYPGLIRVLQTAGRVIRSEQDEGVVCLVDCRYRQARYSRLLPKHWQLTYVEALDELTRSLFDFWNQR